MRVYRQDDDALGGHVFGVGGTEGVDHGALLTEGHVADDVLLHLAAVDQAHGHPVQGLVVERQGQALADAVANELGVGIVVGRVGIVQGAEDAQAAVDALALQELHPHDLDADAHGTLVVDLVDEVGVEGQGLDGGLGHVVAARPVLVVLGAQTETGEDAGGEPPFVVELTGVVELRRQEGIGLARLVLIVVHIHLAARRNGAEARVQVVARQVRRPRGVVRGGGGILGVGDHGSAQGVAARAPLVDTKPGGHGRPRHERHHQHG